MGGYSRIVTNASEYAAFLKTLEMFRTNEGECEVAVESTGNTRYFAPMAEARLCRHPRMDTCWCWR